jgi:hypothetical protein
MIGGELVPLHRGLDGLPGQSCLLSIHTVGFRPSSHGRFWVEIGGFNPPDQ